MPNKTIFIIFCLISACSSTALCQEDSSIKELIENISENISEDFDIFELTERLTYYRSHPLNLNEATEAQLKELVFLTPIQINNLLKHISINGKLISLLELQSIEGFEVSTISKLSNIVTVGAETAISKIKKDARIHLGQHDLIMRYGTLLQTPKGFTDLPGSRYLGNKDKLLLRYRFSLDKTLSVGLVMEKDTGEYVLNSKLGADHVSGNIAIHNAGRVQKLVIGDYSLQFGQGLILWSGFSLGKGADITSVAARDLGLRPYSSSNELSFFRGLSGTLVLRRDFLFTPFISIRKRDASLKFSDDSSLVLQTLSSTGLHRTKTELQNQNSVNQSVYGAVLQQRFGALNLGLIGYKSHYSHNFITGNQPYNKYSFVGNDVFNTGLYYSYSFKNIYTYGELAHSLSSGWAFINGLLISLSPKVSTVLLVRSYDKDYHNFFSSGVGENTETSNEKGIYGGLNYSPNRVFTYSFYGDYFKFPWLRYRVNSPSSGYEVFGQLAYTPSKKTKYLLRLKREIKTQNADASDTISGLRTVCKQYLRLGSDWRLSPSIQFQHRVEFSYYQKGREANELGQVFYTDLNYRKTGSKLSGNFRLAYFKTPSYDSRIYAYEDDVLYGAGSGI